MANINHLEALPPELITIITSFIPGPTDLKNLCLTSRTLRLPAMDHLYRDVAVEKCSNFELGRGLLSANNSGLQSIRSFSVQAADTSSCEEERAFIKQVLPLISRNRLTEVTVALDRDIVSALCLQQGALQTLRLGPLLFDFAADLRTNTFGSQFWNGLHTIDMPVALGSTKDLEAYCELLKRNPSVRSLSITCNRKLLLDSTETLVKDGFLEDGTVRKKLFSHIIGSDSANKLRLVRYVLQFILHWIQTLGNTHRSRGPDTSRTPLTWVPDSLILINRDFEFSSRTLSQVIDFQHLCSLCLKGCSHCSSFLTALASKFQGSNHVLRVFSIKRKTGSLERGPIEQLLRSVRGLKAVRIAGALLDGEFDMKALDGHKTTLETLLIAFGTGNQTVELMRLPLDYHTQLEKFTSLRYLAVPMPVLTLSGAAESAKEWAPYQAALSSIFNLPNLRAVRFLTFPLVPEGFFLEIENADHQEEIEKMNTYAYEQKLRDMVCSQLARVLPKTSIARARMPIVCFRGYIHSIYSDSELLQLKGRPHYYLPVKQTNFLGIVQHSFEETTAMDAFYLEPELRWIGAQW